MIFMICPQSLSREFQNDWCLSIMAFILRYNTFFREYAGAYFDSDSFYVVQIAVLMLGAVCTSWYSSYARKVCLAMFQNDWCWSSMALILRYNTFSREDAGAYFDCDSFYVVQIAALMLCAVWLSVTAQHIIIYMILLDKLYSGLSTWLLLNYYGVDDMSIYTDQVTCWSFLELEIIYKIYVVQNAVCHDVQFRYVCLFW